MTVSQRNTQRWDFNTLREQLSSPVADALNSHENLKIELLCAPKIVADDTTKLLVLNQHKQRIAAILVSSPNYPNQVQTGIDLALKIKHHLGAMLGSVILDPILNGSIDSYTYSILPYCRPLSKGRIGKRIHRLMLRKAVFDWLAQATQSTAQLPPPETIQKRFIAPLEHLEALQICETIRHAALNTLDRIQTEQWRPCHVLTHGDLWVDNILFADKELHDPTIPSSRFVLIDWAGGIIDGYAIFDLIRLSISMNISSRALRLQVCRHCGFLECDLQDARSHLLVAIGHISMNLGHFPLDKFDNMATQCIQTLDQAIPECIH